MKIVAVVLAVIVLVIKLLQYKLVKKYQITIEQLNELSPNTYEVYFIGDKTELDKIKPGPLKKVDIKSLVDYKKNPKETLPFNFSKTIIVSAINIGYYEKFTEVAKYHDIKFYFINYDILEDNI